MKSLKIACPNGHLGFAPIRDESFQLGVLAGPDIIAAVGWAIAFSAYTYLAAGALRR